MRAATLVWVLVASALPGCSLHYRSESEWDWGAASPAAAGGSDPALDSLVRAIRVQHPVPALAAAVVAGDSIRSAAVGLRRLGAADPVLTTDRFHLGSVTKSMTAAMIATLVDEGALTWSTRPLDVFPELAGTIHPSLRDVTLEQLLSHTSGLAPFLDTEAPEFRAVPAFWGDAHRQRLAFVRWLLQRAPASEPGSRYEYGNADYGVAAAMAERVTGRTWEALMRERLFRPLGLRSARFGWPGETPSQPWGHAETDGLLQPVGPGSWSEVPAFIAPAANVQMSLDDLARYARFHLQGLRGQGTLLRPETFRKLHRSVVAVSHPAAADLGYALGWQVRPRQAPPGQGVSSHTGDLGTFIAVLRISPAHDRAYVVLTNAYSGNSAQAIPAAVRALERRFGRSPP